ncbi:hypothetical protein N9250_02085 [bacterium]|nr:hypothetical protein [bacterium]
MTSNQATAVSTPLTVLGRNNIQRRNSDKMVRLTSNLEKLHQGDVRRLEVSLEPMLRRLKSDRKQI